MGGLRSAGCKYQLAFDSERLLVWCISIASRECRGDCGSSQSVLCRGVCASVRQNVAQSSESRVDVVADRSVWKVIFKDTTTRTNSVKPLGGAFGVRRGLSGWLYWTQWPLLALEEEVCLVWSAEATRWDLGVFEVFVAFVDCGTRGLCGLQGL